MVRYLLCAMAAAAVGCGGTDVSDGQPSTHPLTPQVAPNLPITKIVNGDDAGVNHQWPEMCYYQMVDHVYAMHSFPGIEAVTIYEHVKVYEALDVPVPILSPLVTYGEAWYDCGPVGKTMPMIIFNWI